MAAIMVTGKEDLQIKNTRSEVRQGQPEPCFKNWRQHIKTDRREDDAEQAAQRREQGRFTDQKKHHMVWACTGCAQHGHFPATFSQARHDGRHDGDKANQNDKAGHSQQGAFCNADQLPDACNGLTWNGRSRASCG